MRSLMNMPNNQSSRSSGFTLVELMLAITISIFLIGGVVLIQSSSRAASIEAERLSRIQESVRFNSDILVRDLRNAGFRDQLSLTIGEFQIIGDEFAAVNGNRLTIRYSGRGHCGEPFQVGGMLEASIVKNEYYVNADGEFKCKGSLETLAADGTIDVIDSKEFALTDGVRDVRFQLMCPSGSTNTDGCTSCPLWVNSDDFNDEQEILNDTCYGVRIGLLLEPVGADADPVPVEFSAAFRNIVLGKLMWDAVPDLP